MTTSTCIRITPYTGNTRTVILNMNFTAKKLEWNTNFNKAFTYKSKNVDNDVDYNNSLFKANLSYRF